MMILVPMNAVRRRRSVKKIVAVTKNRHHIYVMMFPVVLPGGENVRTIVVFEVISW